MDKATKTRPRGALFPSLFLTLAGAAFWAWGAEPAVSPRFEEGERLSYKLVEDGSTGAAMAVEGLSKPAYVSGIPNSAIVLVKGFEPCGERRCFSLQIDAQIPPFDPQYQDGDYPEQTFALVDTVTAEVRSMTSKITIGHSVSTTTHAGFDRATTIGSFFGPWMLDLEDGYRQSFKHSRADITVEVVGRETVLGRECFVVKRTTSSGARASTTTFWVDARRRYAVKVTKGARTLALEK